MAIKPATARARTARGAVRESAASFREDTMKPFRVLIAAFALLAGGCAHQVSFHEHSYTIASPKSEASVVAVIDAETVARKVPIKSFMTGIAHTWEAEPGDMLKQVAAIELPQVFARYEHATEYKEPGGGGRGLVLVMTVPSYAFDDFHATVEVGVTAYDRGRRQILQKTYKAEGEGQGAKMFWGGAFGMKSAIRQSSLDAYKKIFADLRKDLEAALRT
jgi:hypothetical protein